MTGLSIKRLKKQLTLEKISKAKEYVMEKKPSKAVKEKNS